MNFLIGLLTAIHVMIAVFLIILVLMQKSHEQGVGAAFGGGMTDTVFGGGTVTALVRLTIYCACALLVTTVVLAYLHAHSGPARRSLLQKAGQGSSPTAPMTIPGGMPGSAPGTPSMPPASSSPTPQQQPPPADQAVPSTPQPQPSK